MHYLVLNPHDEAHFLITYLCRMYFPILINKTSPFSILGLLGVIFHFYSNFDIIFCMQTVENLIRRIWLCTVCVCPTKRTLGLYGLRPSKEIVVEIYSIPFVHPNNSHRSNKQVVSIHCIYFLTNQFKHVFLMFKIPRPNMKPLHSR